MLTMNVLLSSTDIWHKPMLWWFVIPVLVALIWAIFLAIDSRVPHPRKVIKKLRDMGGGKKQNGNPAVH